MGLLRWLDTFLEFSGLYFWQANITNILPKLNIREPLTQPVILNRCWSAFLLEKETDSDNDQVEYYDTQRRDTSYWLFYYSAILQLFNIHKLNRKQRFVTKYFLPEENHKDCSRPGLHNTCLYHLLSLSPSLSRCLEYLFSDMKVNDLTWS